MATKVAAWDRVLSRAEGRAAELEGHYRQVSLRLRADRERADKLVQAREIAQAVAKEIQTQAHHRIVGIVSECLRIVFDDPYEMKVDFVTKRGRTEAVLGFERNGVVVDPMTAAGGGVVDVAAFALRLSCLLLTRPEVRRVLILDEPFRSPSPHYRERIRQMIERLAERLKIQFIVVTNIEELETGTVVEIRGGAVESVRG